MVYKNVIFDFDGTLLDTSLLENYFHLLRGHDRYSIEHQLAKKEFLTHIKECKIYDGLNQVFDYIKSNGIDAYILTAGSKDRVNRFIRDFELKGIFSPSRVIGRYELGINKPTSKKYGNPALFNKLLEKYNLNPDECVAFGNEIWDKFAANEAYIASYNCLWGANSIHKFVMKQLSPDCSIEKPIDIIPILSA